MMTTDPVCGMTVDPATAAAHFDYEGVTYYFCSTHCLDRFRAAPNQYVKRATDAGMTQPTARSPLDPDDAVDGGSADPRQRA